MLRTIDQMMGVLTHSGLTVPSGAAGQFEIYLRFLQTWNQRINLVARGEESKIVERHFLESAGWLKAFPFPENARVLDLGTGAGFPGLPMAIMRPDLKMVLVDSNRKKILFLKNLVEALDCPSVQIVLGRTEELAGRIGQVDGVVSRAVTHTSNLILWTEKILKRPGGTVLALKGPDVDEEKERLREMQERGVISEWSVQEFDPFPGIPFSKTSHMIRISA